METSPIGIKLTFADVADNVAAADRWNSKGAEALNAEYVFGDVWLWEGGDDPDGGCSRTSSTGVTWDETTSPCEGHSEVWRWGDGVWGDQVWTRHIFGAWPGNCSHPNCPEGCESVAPPGIGDYDGADVYSPCNGPPVAVEPFVFYGEDEAAYAAAYWSFSVEIGYDPEEKRRWITVQAAVVGTLFGIDGPTWTLEETEGVSAPFALLDLEDEEIPMDGDVPEGFPGDWYSATLTVSGYRPE